jgi:hypothetical protein
MRRQYLIFYLIFLAIILSTQVVYELNAIINTSVQVANVNNYPHVLSM